MSLYDNTSMITELLNKAEAFPMSNVKTLETLLIERSFTTLELKGITTIGSSAFCSCSNLTTVSFPDCTSIGESAFMSCTSLTTANFPMCTKIGSGAFNQCSALSRIDLMASTVCALVDSTAFSGTGITRSTGSIFVPASLVSSYKKDLNNWIYFSNRIFSGEE